MSSRVLVVILALALPGFGLAPLTVGCSRGDPSASTVELDASGSAGATATAAGQADATPSDAITVAPDALAAAPTVRPPKPSRPRVPLLTRRGNSEGPIPYRVVEPGKGHAKTPLVIALHGRGDNAEGFSRLAMRLGMDARIIIAEAPMPFGLNGGRQWYDMSAADAAVQVRTRVQELAALCDKLAVLFPDSGKPTIYGFSQGAVVAMQAAHEMPDRFAGVAALSGYLATEDGAAVPTTPLPVLVTAGTKDHVIPQERSWAAAIVLEKQGLAVKRFAFEGTHSVPPMVIDELVAFLESAAGAEAARTLPPPKTP